MKHSYEHWFWNSRLMVNVAHRLSKISDWLWIKMYARETTTVTWSVKNTDVK